MRINRDAYVFKYALRFAEAVQGVEHFAFEALQMLQRDVEKITAPARRIKHAHATQAPVKLFDRRRRRHFVTALRLRHRARQHVRPFFSKRLDDRRQHKALDISARRVVRAEFVSFSWIERAL